MVVKCTADSREEGQIQAILSSDEEALWLDELRVKDSLAVVKQEATSKVKVVEENSLNHDVVLMKKTRLGSLQMVKSVKEKKNKQLENRTPD